jgi:hypothetical protein
LVLSRLPSLPLSWREARVIAGWEMLTVVFGPPCRELNLAEQEFTLRWREACADLDNPEKRRCALEAEEARDVAKAIVESLEIEYSIGLHCTAGRRPGSNDNEDG